LKTITMAENKAIAVSTWKQVLAVGAMGADSFILIVASTATEELRLSLNVGLINLRWHSSRSWLSVEQIGLASC
jgi:hypothetical protein